MHLDHALALDHTGIAGVAFLEDGLDQRGAVDVLALLEGALGVVARGLAAHLVLDGEHPRRAVLTEPLDAGVGLFELLEPLDEPAKELGHGRLRRFGPAHDHRLEPLRSHDGAETGAPVRAIDHVHDGGEAHAILPGGADLGDLHLLVAQLFLDERVHLARDLAPEMLGGPELGLAVVEPEVDRLLRLAGEDEGIRSRRAHLGGEESAALAVADGPGERRAGAGRHAALAGDGEPGERAHRHDQDIVGAEGIGARGNRLQQKVGGEGAASRVLAVDVFGQGFGLDGAATQVDVVHGGGECQGSILPGG